MELISIILLTIWLPSFIYIMASFRKRQACPKCGCLETDTWYDDKNRCANRECGILVKNYLIEIKEEQP